MTAMMANPKKKPYQPMIGNMGIQEYNTRKKYADMGFSERMTDFLSGAENAKQQEEAAQAAREQKESKAKWEAFLSSQNMPYNWTQDEYQKELQRREEEKLRKSGAVVSTPRISMPRNISGYPVKSANRVISLRPGAGINPMQSTYGFSSMQPSNRAGELYTIDQWGNKKYL